MTALSVLAGKGSAKGLIARIEELYDLAEAGITINDDADNRVLTATGSSDTLQAEDGLLFNAGVLTVNADVVIGDLGNIGSATTPGAVTIAANGDVTFAQFPITPSAAPDANYEVANKKYVDDQVSAGAVTLNNNTDNYMVTMSGVANTLQGEANCQFDGTDGTIAGYGKWQFGDSTHWIGLDTEEEMEILTLTDPNSIHLNTPWIYLGTGGDVDPYIYFYANTNSGFIRWKEDENYFDIPFVTLISNKLAFTQTDLNEYIDSLADGYMDYGATTWHRFNNTISVTTSNEFGYMLDHNYNVDLTSGVYSLYIDTDITANVTLPAYGIYNNITMTTNTSNLIGFYSRTYHVTGTLSSELMGIYNETEANNDTISDSEIGLWNQTEVNNGASITNDSIGIYAYSDLNGGTVTRDVYGIWTNVDIEAAMTSIGGNVYGHYIQVDADKDPTGTVYCIYMDDLTNVDYGIYQNGSADNYLGGTATINGLLTVSSGITGYVDNNTNNYILTSTGGNTINGEANAQFNGSTLAVTGSQTISANLTLSAFTQKSVFFAGAAGLVSQDNSNFNWDDTTNCLNLGTTTSTGSKMNMDETYTALGNYRMAYIVGNSNVNSAAATTTNHYGVQFAMLCNGTANPSGTYNVIGGLFGCIQDGSTAVPDTMYGGNFYSRTDAGSVAEAAGIFNQMTFASGTVSGIATASLADVYAKFTTTNTMAAAYTFRNTVKSGQTLNLTNHYGLYWDNTAVSGTLNVTNWYGIYFPDMSSMGSVISRAIHTAGGDWFLGGQDKLYINDTNTYIWDDGTDLELATNGVLKFGTHAAIGAETVTGYITIKDSAGNLRKVAVVS